jgi:UDP-N-acetylmuramoyl-tripeptide--D-alanyl-D-alanine ligase
MDLSASEVTRICSGRLLGGDPDRRLYKIVLDSRAIEPGCLFAALPGARADGHDFVPAAVSAGAAGALVMRPVADAPPDAVLIEVADTTVAIQELASHWRDRLRGRVIGVAGSNGKTSTKETIAAVLRRAGSVWATPGNANSQVGAPLALLDSPEDVDFCVLELGTSAPGELARLARMARPDHAIITAAFAEHLEWLGSIEGVIEAETEILDSLSPQGTALVGSAEPRLLVAARNRSKVKISSLGMGEEDDWQLASMRTAREGTLFELRDPGGSLNSWQIPLLGAPAAWAGGFAVATGQIMGVQPEAIAAGLSDVLPAAHRLTALVHPSEPLVVVDDCYNSNPASCIAAFDAAADLTGDESRLVVVVGDMLELGEATRAAHEEVADALIERANRIDSVVAVGPSSRRIAQRAADEGMDSQHVENAEEATLAVQSLLADRRPTTLLAKASRGVGLDRLVASLIPSGE